MTALTQGRNTPRIDGVRFSFPMLAAVVGLEGGIAVLDGGFLKPGVTETGSVCVGRFNKRADNSSGANGDINGEVEAGIFRFANSAGGDEIALDDVGADCYIVDDQTVALTDGTNTRSLAGRIKNVDAQGVWVEIKA